MKLVRLRKGSKWDVCAICKSDDCCPLLDFIATLDSKKRSKILSDLREYVPHSSNTDWAKSEFSKQLKDSNILEFRWFTRRGGTPRVYFFFDAGHVVVCCNGEDKKGDLDEDLISAAEEMRKEYLGSRAQNNLSFCDFEKFDAECDDESKEK